MINSFQLTEMFYHFMCNDEGRRTLRFPLYFNELDSEVRDSNHRSVWKTTEEGVMELWGIYDAINRYQSVPFTLPVLSA